MIKWYVAQLLFAQVPVKNRKMYMCETSTILIQAENASEAYDKTNLWGINHVSESIYHIELVGITGLKDIEEETISDGTEIYGSLFVMKEIWKRKDIVIPAKDELSAFMLENNRNIPIEELLTEIKGKHYVNILKKLK